MAAALAAVAVAAAIASTWIGGAGSGGGSSASDARPGENAPDGDLVGDEAPFTVHVRPYAYEHPCDQRLLVDRPPTSVAPPPEGGDVTDWVRGHEAVPADEQRVGLTVQGTGADTVVLEAAHVRVVERSTPLTWDEYALARYGCGGTVHPRPLSVDLDSANPVLDPGEEQQGFPFTVEESDPEVLFVTALTAGHDVAWDLTLEWSSGGRSGTVRVDDGGAPFRTSASGGTTQYSYTSGVEWEPHLRE
ncbi:hypothetical protein HCJ92_02400 [Streptomyces sp. ventii]|uniref:Transcriptional regulator n=1 Tax=Streptomyces spiramenti TaxID=2720606 RepID=A0ABX1ALK4_9ACTN|nr:hypothetical protein [Streptomyces spiramenti]